MDVRLLHVPRAGSATYTASLLRELIPLARDDEFVLISGPRPEPLPFAAAPNVTEYEFLDARLCDERWEQLVLPAELQRISPDVFLSPTITLPMLRSCPMVLIVYDLGFEAHPEFYAPELRRYLKRWAPPSCRLADRIVTLSEFGRSEIQSTYGVSGDKVDVIPGATDERFRKVDDPDALAAIKQRHRIDGPFVLSVAGLEKNKNLPRLLQAFRLAIDQGNDDWRLALTGRPGGAAADLDAMVQHLELERYVIITGFVPDEELPLLYNAADVFAFVSLYEGFGLPPLEAMACGAPILCSHAASLPEVVGDAARLVAPESENDIAAVLLELMGDEGLRTHLADEGPKRAATFSWRRSAELMLDVLRGTSWKEQPSPQPVRHYPMRILVIRKGAWGDVLQSTPILRALKQKWPGCQIGYYVGEEHLPILEGNPHVDHVCPDHRPFTPRAFDAIINLNGAYEEAPDRPEHHRIYLYARRAGVEVRDSSLVLVLTDEERALADEMAQAHGLGDGEPVIAFGLRARSVPERCWFDDRWQALADRLGRDGHKILTFGAPSEDGLEGDHVINAMGQADLRIGRALMDHCDLVVSVDTAWIHIAAAAGKPIVGLFGADLPQCVLPPEGDWIGIIADLPCSPCYSQCSNDRDCMRRITPEIVHSLIGRKLDMIGREESAHREVVRV